MLLGHALVRDARGHEMHKSAGNSIAFDEAAEAFGAEIMRYLFAAQNPVTNLSFPDLPSGDERTKKSSLDGEVRRKLLTFWNCYSFFVTYARADVWTPGERLALADLTELDRWILSRTQRLIRAAHDAFADYSLHRFMGKLEQFTDGFSNWYLRRSRRRFWKSEADADKSAAYQTLYDVLTTLVRLLAPVLPFLTEEMYQNLVRAVAEDAPVSVHLTDYPQVDETLVNDALEAQIECVLRTKNVALALRNRAKVRARQPLGKLIVRPRSAADRAVLADEHFAAQILEECNIKALELIDDETDLVTTRVKPSFKTLGPRYGKLMKAIAAHLQAADPHELQAAVADGTYSFELDGTTIELGATDLDVSLEGPDHLAVIAEHGTFAALDTTITPELEAEGIARDFNRHAQDRRKAMNLAVTDRIRVRYQASDRIAAAIETHIDYLRAELLADTIKRADVHEPATGKVGGENISLDLQRRTVVRS